MDKKSEFIIVRVQAETKRRLAEVAESRGQNLSTFLLQAAEQAARTEPKMPLLITDGRPVKPKGRGPCPTWFLATCHEASRGGNANYGWAGRKLLRALTDEQPHELEFDEWNERLDQLEDLLANAYRGVVDDEAVLGWFKKWLPRCVKLVPARRREQFLKGVYEEYAENGLQR